jgi:Na+-driven multidrug efflux pump
LAWQVAFACNLVVSTGGDAGIQLATRCGDKGIRTAGLAIGATGLLNLGLSIVFMRLGSITGIAVATVIAQSVLSLSLGWYTCRHLGFPATRWAAKSWGLPLAIVLIAALIKAGLPGYSFSHIGILSGCYAVLLLAATRLAGVNLETLHAEWAVLRSMLKR